MKMNQKQKKRMKKMSRLLLHRLPLQHPLQHLLHCVRHLDYLIFTTVNPKYGNPNPYTLTTLPASGGTEAILRTDVLAADYFDLLITHPNSFSSSPTLTDSIGFTGTSVVSAVGVAGMSVYETNKLVVNNTTRFRLLLAGATWYKVSSVMIYGATDTTALPAGNYTSLITATCLAR